MRKALICCLMLLLIGCASGTQVMQKIDPGMSPQEVEELMGRRDSFKTVEKDGSMYTLYQYTNRYCNANQSLWDKCDFFIIFKNNKVIETGVASVRSHNPNMHFMYLFQY